MLYQCTGEFFPVFDNMVDSLVDSYDLCEVAARVLARIPNEQSVKIDPHLDGSQSLWKHCKFDQD